MGKTMVKPRVMAPAVLPSGVHQRASRPGALVHGSHPALDRPSFDVDPRDPETIELAAALIGTMKVTPGCRGLSAPQLGVNARLFCFDATGHEEARSCSGLVVLANPEVLSVSGHVLMREECTSLPHVHAAVARASSVVVTGVVPGSARTVVILADAFEARCILHELDHLDGIMMLDRVADPLAHVHAVPIPR